MDKKTAISVMLDNPTIIRRPVLDLDGSIHVGFSESEYRKLFDRTR
jgi:arsenate reductase